MKKFTKIKESQDAQKSFVSKVEFTINTKATSESEAAKLIQEIVETTKKTNPNIASSTVTSIKEEMVNSISEKANQEKITKTMKTDLIDVRKNNLDDAIKSVDNVMKEYKKKEGDTHNQQFAELENIKKSLTSHKKNMK